MPVMFLDIDGVLNFGKKFKLGVLEESLVRKLNLLPLSELEIVIISSWRRFMSPREIELKLIEKGFKGKVKSSLDEKFDRIEGISSRVRTLKPNTKFVVVDDIKLDLPTTIPQIVVNQNIGISFRDICRINLKIL